MSETIDQLLDDYAEHLASSLLEKHWKGEAIEWKPPTVEWQPIETAPLDGTIVDLWAVRDSPFNREGRYADCRFARNSYGTEPYGEPRWQGLNDRYIKVTPTHWMPLPSSPKPLPTPSIQVAE